MRRMPFGPQRLAVISGLFALLLADCATQSTPVVLVPNSRVLVAKRKTFHYTGGKQIFIVPAGVKKVMITADGASGADYGEYLGGRGGLIRATVSVTPDEALAIVVGASGGHGGFNGGGRGGGSGSYAASAGGGASDVRIYDSGRRLVEAGGGGGAGAASGYSSYCSGLTCTPNPSLRISNRDASGGDGGGGKGAKGRTGSSSSYDDEVLGGDGGAGGAQATGGNGGKGGGGSGSCSGGAGTNGTRYKGGTGGGGCFAGGGGGGGGHYGGGGGGGGDSLCGPTYYGEFTYCTWGGGGGGGGGSSFIEKTAIKIENVRGGAPPGDGLVVISW
jgi:hypothetical protein